MKKESLRLAAIALCVSAMCGSAFAADNSTSGNSSGNSANDAQNMPASDSKVPLSLNRASKVIGTNVADANGNKIGDIKDVVLDRKTGQVAYAVVDFGGWLGMGDKYFAVPWKSLKTGSNDRYVLNVSKDTLKKAPGFDKDHWPDMASASWNRENARAFNQKPYWEQAASSSHHRMHSGNRSAGSSKGASSSSSGSPARKSYSEDEPAAKSH